MIETATERIRSHALSRKLAQKEIDQSIIIIFAMLNGLAEMAVGEEARMNDAEKDMISLPLEHILARMDIASSGVLNKYLDPIMLCMGLIAWGRRISDVRKTKTTPPAVEGEPQTDKPKPPTKDDKPEWEKVSGARNIQDGMMGGTIQ